MSCPGVIYLSETGLPTGSRPDGLMLKDLFISEVRVNMLKLFLLEGTDPERGLHVREITRRVGTEINAVRRELDRLVALKMLLREARGNRVYYRLREDFPLKPELVGLLVKDSGLGALLIKNHRRLGRLSYILVSKEFLFGRKAKASEVDVLFVGTVSVEAVQSLMNSEEKVLGKEIQYCVMGEEEFEFRKQKRDSFLLDILVRPYVLLWGDELKFAAFP